MDLQAYKDAKDKQQILSIIYLVYLIPLTLFYSFAVWEQLEYFELDFESLCITIVTILSWVGLVYTIQCIGTISSLKNLVQLKIISNAMEFGELKFLQNTLLMNLKFKKASLVNMGHAGVFILMWILEGGGVNPVLFLIPMIISLIGYKITSRDIRNNIKRLKAIIKK